MLRTLLLAPLLLSFCFGAIRAEPLPGQTDPRFAAALEAWLADDDAAALPQLAGLSAAGNRAAQVLLSLVDRTPVYQGPWLVGQDRKDRIALTRSPGGLSGRSWMEAAAVDTPLARLWIQRAATDTTLETAMAFAALGEERAARETLQALAARQYRGFAAVADDPAYPPDLRHLIWREWAATPDGRARAEAEIAALMPGDPQIHRFAARTVAPAEFDDWLAVAPLAAPLRATCDAACPATPLSCRRAAFRLVDGHALLAEFGTPSETLVPPAVWTASPRGQKALLRLAPARYRFASETAAVVRGEDACLAEALAAEVARYFQ